MHIGNHKQNGWKIPVVAVRSISGEGVEELKHHLDAHLSFLREDTSGIQKKKERLKTMMLSLLKEETWNILIDKWSDTDGFKGIIRSLRDGKVDPYTAVHKASEMMFNNAPSGKMKFPDGTVSS
jgi:putative protein kinase ArgK-like GTPase of G3E family